MVVNDELVNRLAQPLLRLEVMLNEADGDTRFCGDGAHRHFVLTRCRVEVKRSVPDPRPSREVAACNEGFTHHKPPWTASIQTVLDPYICTSYYTSV